MVGLGYLDGLDGFICRFGIKDNNFCFVKINVKFPHKSIFIKII